MLKFGIVTSYTPSLTVVGKDICNALRRLGYDANLYQRQIFDFEAIKKFNRAIVFMTFDPLYCGPWFLLARDYNKSGLSALIYTTVEGYPKRVQVPKWFKRDCNFVAVSNFVKERLIELEQNVIAVVKHGVDLELVRQAEQGALALKLSLKRRLKARVLFGTVASSHKRKGLEYLAKAMKIVEDKEKEIGFYVLTTPSGREIFKELHKVIVDTNFGKLPRKKVLSLIGSFDFYLHPALCEGFGLPLLEANAFGVPCVFPAYEPLTEVVESSTNFPFTWDYEDIRDLGDGILYICHIYSPETMAEKVKEAYEVYTCNEEEYRERSMKVKVNAEKSDIVNAYRKFVELLRV